MQFIWNDLIARARLYVDDDHADTDGWIAEANWMQLTQVEYAQLYRRWIRQGLVVPPTKDYPFSGSTTTLSGVLALVGVAQDKGGYIRVVAPAQSVRGQYPFWQSATQANAISTAWMATGTGDSLTVTLDPPDYPTANYFVRYVQSPPYATDWTTTVDLPYGCDERLVLGTARRAHLKDAQKSALLDELIREADVEIAFTAHARIHGESPRVRKTPRWQRLQQKQDSTLFPSDPRMWIYP